MDNREIKESIDAIGTHCLTMYGAFKAQQVVMDALIAALAEHEPATLSLLRAQIPNAARFVELDPVADESFRATLKVQTEGIDMLLGL